MFSKVEEEGRTKAGKMSGLLRNPVVFLIPDHSQRREGERQSHSGERTGEKTELVESRFLYSHS